MARKIAFLNYKGGVGKTSLIVNLAACLAKAGQRVLLFDFDTQSNASIWLLRLERWNKINNSGRWRRVLDFSAWHGEAEGDRGEGRCGREDR